VQRHSIAPATFRPLSVSVGAVFGALACLWACEREPSSSTDAPKPATTKAQTQSAGDSCASAIANTPNLASQLTNLHWRQPREQWPDCADVSAKLATKPAPLAQSDQTPLWTFLDLSQGMAGFAAEGSTELLFSAAREQSKGFGGICGFSEKPIQCRLWAEYGQHRADFAAVGRSADLAAAIRAARDKTPAGNQPSGAIIVTEGISDQRTDAAGNVTRVTPDVAAADVAVELAQAVSEERGIWLAVVSAPFSGKVYMGAATTDLPPASRCRDFIERQSWYQLATKLTGKGLKIDCKGEMALGGYRGPRTLMIIGLSSPQHHREIAPSFNSLVGGFQASARQLFQARDSTVSLGSAVEPVQLAPRQQDLRWTSVANPTISAQRVGDHTPRISAKRQHGRFTVACGQSGLVRWGLAQQASTNSQLPVGYSSELQVLVNDGGRKASGQSLRMISQAGKKGTVNSAFGLGMGDLGMAATVDCAVAVGHRAKFVDDEGRIPLQAIAVSRLASASTGAILSEADALAALPPGLRAALAPAAEATATVSDLNSNALIAAPWQIPSLRRFVVGLQQAVHRAGLAKIREQAEGTRGCIAGCSQLTLVVPERVDHDDQVDDGCGATGRSGSSGTWVGLISAAMGLMVVARRRGRRRTGGGF
jgi:hypothetical protein